MSEKQEHRKRFNLRYAWVVDYEKWLNSEPPMWRIFSWHRWKNNRPKWEEVE